MYTVDYFINKFEAIPEEDWTTGLFIDDYSGACCANGHCGVRYESILAGHITNEAVALQKVFSCLTIYYKGPWNLGREIVDNNGLFPENYSTKAAEINNGLAAEYQQPTPKQRILAALYDIKKLQSPKVKEKIVYVAVPVTITEQAKELVMS